MNLIDTGLEGLFVIEPKVFGDSRGYFFESFNEKSFETKGLKYHFVQDNESFSNYGTLRGLHFQKGSSAQAKLVRVVNGKVLDVAVDIRPNSKTFGKHFSIELTGENKKMMIIPRGFAHGFVVLSETALFTYKCDNFYSPIDEGGIIFNDSDLNIDWKVPSLELILSDKDKKNSTFATYRNSL
jgi:dTDP-4-dehydrorhamnose 3,5-epimerase